jgi:hypothetical protein
VESNEDPGMFRKYFLRLLAIGWGYFIVLGLLVSWMSCSSGTRMGERRISIFLPRHKGSINEAGYDGEVNMEAGAGL